MVLHESIYVNLFLSFPLCKYIYIYIYIYCLFFFFYMDLHLSQHFYTFPMWIHVFRNTSMWNYEFLDNSHYLIYEASFSLYLFIYIYIYIYLNTLYESFLNSSLYHFFSLIIYWPFDCSLYFQISSIYLFMTLHIWDMILYNFPTHPFMFCMNTCLSLNAFICSSYVQNASSWLLILHTWILLFLYTNIFFISIWFMETYIDSYLK